MTTKHPRCLGLPLHCAIAPEFRAAQHTFGNAYSGPEQRQRMPHRVHLGAAPELATAADIDLFDAVAA